MSGIEAVVRRHVQTMYPLDDVWRSECDCGEWTAEDSNDETLIEAHCAHVAAEIEAWLLADEQRDRASGGLLEHHQREADDAGAVYAGPEEFRCCATAALTAVLGGGD